MVRLDDFDVVFGTEPRRSLAYKRSEKIDAERHISGFDNRNALGERSDFCAFIGGKPGCSDYVGQAGGGGEAGVFKARCRSGEIYERICAADQNVGCFFNNDAETVYSRERAKILTDRRMTGALETPCDRNAGS